MAVKSEVATKTDMADLRTEFAVLRGEVNTLKWMVGVNSAGIAVIIGLLLSLLRALPP